MLITVNSRLERPAIYGSTGNGEVAPFHASDQSETLAKRVGRHMAYTKFASTFLSDRAQFQSLCRLHLVPQVYWGTVIEAFVKARRKKAGR